MGKDSRRTGTVAGFEAPISSRTGIRAMLVGLAVGLLALGLAPSAMAQTQNPQDPARWTCRGSAVRASALDLERVEPVVANGNATNANPDRANCVDELNQATDVQIPTGVTFGLVDAESARAQTTIEPNTGPTRNQAISAFGSVEDLDVNFLPGNAAPGIAINVEAAEAFASLSCTPGQSSLSSRAVNITINGNTINLDPVLEGVEQITAGPLGQIVRVEVNKTIVNGRFGDPNFEVIRRAVEITILDPAAPGDQALLKLVAGEAKVDSHANPCLPGQEGNPCPPGTQPFDDKDPSNNPDPLICVFIVDTGKTPPCVVPEFELNGRCVLAIAANTSGFEIGGFLVPLIDLRGDRRFSGSPCVRGNEPGFGIVGTNGPDRITGTNGPDRIFSLGGNDRVDGGRGNDCVEGGSGRDVLDGANNNDRLRGDTGSDILNGGSGRDRIEGQQGNDRVNGGSGVDNITGAAGRDRLFSNSGNDRVNGGAARDFINTGNGRDRINGGAGPDTINGSTAGKPSTINCGPGGGTARVNPNERRRTRGCTRVMVVRSR